MIRKLAITGGFCLGLILAAIFERFEVGKHYVALSFACALALYWTIEFIISYIAFRKTYQKKYQYYKATLVNKSNLTLEQIENSNKIYYKKFKRTMLKDSVIKLLEIGCAFGLMLAFLLTMVIR